MSFRFAAHIPLLYDLSLDAAGPVVVEYGNAGGRMPRTVYLQAIMAFSRSCLNRNRYTDYVGLHRLYRQSVHQHSDVVANIAMPPPFTFNIFPPPSLGLGLGNASPPPSPSISGVRVLITALDHAFHDIDNLGHIYNYLTEICREIDTEPYLLNDTCDCIRRVCSRCMVIDANYAFSLSRIMLSRYPRAEIRSIFIDYGAHVSDDDEYRLWHAAVVGDAVSVQNAILDGYDYNARDGPEDWYLLDYVALSDDVAMVKNLLDLGALSLYAVNHAIVHENIAMLEVFAKADRIDTSLDTHFEFVHSVRIARFLVSHGCNTSTAIADAVRNRHIDIVRYLVDEVGLVVPADVIMTTSLLTPDLFIADYLGVRGADVACMAPYGGGNVLHTSWYCARYWCENGADVNVKNRHGETVKDMVIRRDDGDAHQRSRARALICCLQSFGAV